LSGIFFDIGIIIIAATIGGFLARLLKQPLISFYIIMGILVGPILGIIKDMAVVDVLSEIGIAFLLFIVGIELDLKRLKDVGGIASIGALAQMIIAFLLGFGIFSAMGFSTNTSIFAGIVLMFSSTMVVIKLLSDKAQLDTLHGRIVIGTLLMQDIVAVVLLSIIGHSGSFSLLSLLFSVFQGLLVFIIAIFFSKVLFPQLFKFAAKSQELFFLLSITVCFIFSLVFTWIGFSIAIGAFVAGLMLGNLPYNVEIVSKVKNLRDFFATVFFVSMGIKVTFHTLTNYAMPFIVLLVLTVIILPFITYLITLLFGYNRKVSFLVSISLSQVSGFALIAIHEGMSAGYVDQGFLSLVIMVALASIVSTAYLMKFEDKIYRKMTHFLKFFDKIIGRKKQFEYHTPHTTHNVVLLGFDRIGSRIYKSLKKLNKDVLIVDFNPEIISYLMEQSVPCLYGDVGDDEVIEKLNLKQVSLVISTIPNHRDTLLMIQRVRRVNPHARIIVTAYIVEEALLLYDAGADYVIVPHLLGGEHAGVLLENVSDDLDKLISTKLNHIDELKKHTQRKFHKRRYFHGTQRDDI